MEVEPNDVINLRLPGQTVINMSAGPPYYGTVAGRVYHPFTQVRSIGVSYLSFIFL